MQTTRMMIEVLVIGLTFLLGALPLLLLPVQDQFTPLAENLTGVAPWIPLLALALVALAYQVGWIINGTTYFLFERIWERRRLNRTFGWNHKTLKTAEAEFRKIFAMALTHDRGNLAETISKDISATRLSRTGLVNLVLIGVSILLWFDDAAWLTALPVFLLAGASYLYSGYRMRRVFELVKHAGDLMLESDLRKSEPEEKKDA